MLPEFNAQQVRQDPGFLADPVNFCVRCDQCLQAGGLKQHIIILLGAWRAVSKMSLVEPKARFHLKVPWRSLHFAFFFFFMASRSTCSACSCISPFNAANLSVISLSHLLINVHVNQGHFPVTRPTAWSPLRPRGAGREEQPVLLHIFSVPTEDLLLGDPQESLASLLLQQSMLVLGREMTVGPASLSCVSSLCRAVSPERQLKDTVVEQAELTPSLPLWEREGAGLATLFFMSLFDPWELCLSR